MFILLFWFASSIAIGFIAEGIYGRSPLGWFFLAIIFSPLLAMLVLLICCGKTIEKRAREQLAIQKRIGELG